MSCRQQLAYPRTQEQADKAVHGGVNTIEKRVFMDGH
jgi:hypothetical protein